MFTGIFPQLHLDRGQNLRSSAAFANIFVQLFKGEVEAFIAVFGLRLLEHADDLLFLFEKIDDRCRKGEPAVEQQIIGADTALSGLPDQIFEHLRSRAHTFEPPLEAVAALIDFGHGRQAIFLLSGTEQAERDRQIAGTIRPAQGQQAEAAIVTVVVMVMNPRQQLDVLAPIAVVERVVNDKHLWRLNRGQRQNFLLRTAAQSKCRSLRQLALTELRKR